MIERIIELSAKNKLLVFLVCLFLAFWGVYCFNRVTLDALPDLSDTQVIVLARWDRPPNIVEDQLTYPIVTSLLGAPKVKTIRGISDYGFSYVYVIFEDGTDIYWARSRVLEYLSKVTPNLPKDARVEIGPDATGVGWVYEYALVDRSGKHSLQELRSFQDWQLKYALQGVPGVAEVASLGGFVKQYQVIPNPEALLAYGIPIDALVSAVRASNQEVGARLLELSGREYMLTVRGYVQNLEDIEAAVLKVDANGTPVTVGDVAQVRVGPEMRRGVAELDGKGEVTGGIVVMRYGVNALEVIRAIEQKMKEVSFPEGIELVPTYNRSGIILEATHTLKKKLLEEMAVVSGVILLFLFHFPSAVIPIATLPFAALLAFIPMYYLGIGANIMSLGGIAIAIGAMVDASIVVVENVYKRIAEPHEQEQGSHDAGILEAIKEVGRPSFYSLLVIAVAFTPIFALEAYEGRMFKPLAYTKNLAMLFSACLAITLDPALRMLLTREKRFTFKPVWLSRLSSGIFVGTYYPEHRHPVSRGLFALYEPLIRFVLKKPRVVIFAAFMLFAISMPLFFKIGSEFMPPLNEGSILYMPTTPPGISITEASKLLQVQDQILSSFPEVERVFGKAGRALTSTDPAPLSMMETTVLLRPQNEWSKNPRWYSKHVPEFLQGPLRLIWPDRIGYEELIAQMDAALKLPGQVNSWTMPVKGRIDMLTTGIRTPVGIKILGDDLSKIERVGADIEAILGGLKGTRSVYAERTAGGYYLDIQPDRTELARYGLTIQGLQETLMSAIGGANVSETIEGRERYPINVRYPTERRDDVESLKRVYVSTPAGAQVPLGQLAELRLKTDPGMIRDENGRLAGYVFVDTQGVDIGSYVSQAKALLRDKLKTPPGYTLTFSGQYESMQRVEKRMRFVVPLTLFIIFLLLYLNTRSYTKTLIVMLAVPFSLIGVAWALWLLGYHFSVGVMAGVIALLGVDAETGIFMLLYLDLAYEHRLRTGKMQNLKDLETAIHEGALGRLRPKMMTVMTMMVGLLPIMWAQTYEIGADVMKRIAAPMVGGIMSSFCMELLVYPAIYLLWKRRGLHKT